MDKFFDKVLVNIALGVPPAIVYLISVVKEGIRYDYNPVYWPANKLFPVFAIAMLITTVCIQINFFRNAKTGLKVAKGIVLALYVASIAMLLGTMKSEHSGVIDTISLVLFLALLPLSFVFNVMTKGSRATQISLAVSAVLAMIARAIIWSGSSSGTVVGIILIVALGVPSAIFIINALFGALLITLDNSKKHSTGRSGYSQGGYSSHDYTPEPATSYSGGYSSPADVNSDDIRSIEIEIENSKARLYDLENRDLVSAQRELEKWENTLRNCRAGNWTAEGYTNLDYAEKEIARNLNMARAKIIQIQKRIEYEQHNLKTLESKL